MDVSVVNETSAGTLMIGGVVSRIVILWVAVSEFPEESVAVQVMMVVSTRNEDGALLLMAGLGSVLSVTFAVPISTSVTL